jgi:regulator of sigma E protease
MSFFITILMLNVIIFIHEFGHLFFAKLGKIGVLEFSIGMGPKLIGTKFKSTFYNLRLFPIGGFVKLAGMDESDETIDESLYFQNASFFSRFATLFAGSFFNIILGFFIFFSIVFFVGKPTVIPVIDSVISNSPAMEQGLLAGDKLISLNDNVIKDVSLDFVSKIHASSDELKIKILRKGMYLDYFVTPFFDDDNSIYRLGIKLQVKRSDYGLFLSINESINMTFYAISQVFLNLKMLVSGTVGFKDLSGPVGIVQFASYQFNQNVIQFFSIMAFISIMLGVINLFPIPVLDGGHILFLCIEGIIKKPLPEKVMIILNNLFILCLFLFMIFIIFNDVFHWNNRAELIQELIQK